MFLRKIATFSLYHILFLGGANKLIRIHYRNGMYGFSQPYQFRSVLELIQYHKSATLKQYNNDLDICLKYPATRAVDVRLLVDVTLIGLIV